jgi:hypothetical protein
MLPLSGKHGFAWEFLSEEILQQEFFIPAREGFYCC